MAGKHRQKLAVDEFFYYPKISHLGGRTPFNRHNIGQRIKISGKEFTDLMGGVATLKEIMKRKRK